jgi:hypothetical protein
LRLLALYEERYAGFTVKHFHEQMTKRHNYKLGYRRHDPILRHRGLDNSAVGEPGGSIALLWEYLRLIKGGARVAVAFDR